MFRIVLLFLMIIKFLVLENRVEYCCYWLGLPMFIIILLFLMIIIVLVLENRVEYCCYWLGLSMLGVVPALINSNLKLVSFLAFRIFFIIKWLWCAFSLSWGTYGYLHTKIMQSKDCCPFGIKLRIKEQLTLSYNLGESIVLIV